MTEEPPVLLLRSRDRVSEPHAVVLRRLFEAMCLAATISPAARAAFDMMFRTAAITAPHGEHGEAASKILAAMHRRLTARLAVDAPPFDGPFDGPEAA